MKTILFVDDESHVLDGFSRMLRSERHTWTLITAESADEALERMEEVPVDAVVTDYNMPGKNGFALLQSIRSSEHNGDVPVIIVTGSAETSLKRTALELGATDLLSKPVDREDLIARLRNVIRIKDYQDAIKKQNEQLENLVLERTAQLAASRHEIIWRLAKAAESRDEDTGNHVVRVACYCRIIAEKLGMTPGFVRLIFMASPLHDIGKIGIPDTILLKPGRLTPEEWHVMRSHCQIGADILRSDITTFMAINAYAPVGMELSMSSDNPILDMAASIALNHHEKWDGSGYPNGLSGEDIPLEARIVALADVYDALCSDRPYKAAMPEEKALSIMAEGRGQHFDPDIYEAFLAALPEMGEVRRHFADQVAATHLAA